MSGSGCLAEIRVLRERLRVVNKSEIWNVIGII